MRVLLFALAGLIVATCIQQFRIVGLQRDNAVLQAAVKAQSDATQKLGDDSKLETSQAAGRALTVLKEGETLKRTLPKGAGPMVMNEFMRQVFP